MFSTSCENQLGGGGGGGGAGRGGERERARERESVVSRTRAFLFQFFVSIFFLSPLFPFGFHNIYFALI